MRAATSLRHSVFGPAIAANPGSASAAVMTAKEPGGPTGGM